MESMLKIYERLLFRRLSMWARSRGLIPDCQFGFRPCSSTLDAVFVFFALLVKYVIVQGSSLFVCLVDFQKAFPSVNDAQLLSKLERLEVSTQFWRSINSTFAGNTFSIRHGSKVTEEFPVSTGLCKGSVFSPLLFVLFMSGIQKSVLCPFSHDEFLKKDPQMNGVPIPGLLYADDLVLFCLTAELLRERLRRLCSYADLNMLTVNVSKCEVVIFGRKLQPLSFRYKRENIPVRCSCKYLGVWLDGALSGKVLADAIAQKFKAAVPIFFGLCRRLRLARLDLVHRLAGSLAFSTLYGCEFLSRYDVIEKCEAFWWSGVRSFYSLPNGVSTTFLKHLFPRVSVRDLVLRAKFGLLFCGTATSDTLFPKAVVCNRGFLLGRHWKGYSQPLLEWSQFAGLETAFAARDMTVVRGVIATSSSAAQDSEWVTLSSMPSTAFADSLFRSPSALFDTMLELSRFGSLGVRIGALTLTGALSTSYAKSRRCVCGTKFSFSHFLECSALGPCRSHSLRHAVDFEEWRDVASIILSRFEVYLHAIRGGEL